MEWNVSFFEISALSALGPIIYGLFKIANLSNPLKVVLSFITISLLTDVINFYFANLVSSNSDLINIYTIVQTSFIGYYFIGLSRKNDKKYSAHVVILSAFLSTILASFFLYDSDSNFNIFSLCFSSIGIIVHCGVYMVNLAKNDFVVNLMDNANFYISSSLLIYHACVFMIFLSFGYFNIEISQELWNIKLAAYIVLNIFILMAFKVDVKD